MPSYRRHSISEKLRHFRVVGAQLFPGDGDVDVRNLIVYRRHKINASDLRDLRDKLRRVPRRVSEWCPPVPCQDTLLSEEDEAYLDLRRTHPPHQVLVERRGILTVRQDLIAEYFCPDLLDGFFGKEAERLRDCGRRYTVAFKADLLHGNYPTGRLEIEVLDWIEILTNSEFGLITQVLWERTSGPCNRLGRWADDKWCYRRLVELA